MIRMVTSISPRHAKAYFKDALSQSDYYVNDQELQGRFKGKLAERLGVAGPATKEVFYSFCENKHPRTDKPLTPRTKENRRIGYDVNFHCPKSVSILHALAKDDHILQAFEISVHDTMLEIETDAKTRVRKGGKFEDRDTGELLWAEFTHQTSRPVDGFAPDPHLHAHCFVFNATHDAVENRIKAGEFGTIKHDLPYYQARFHKRLADRLIALGYEIERTDTSFEIIGVPKEAIRHFSKRTDQIGRVAKAKGITSKKELDALGAKTRTAKQKGLSMAELKAQWRKQLGKLSLDKSFDTSAAIRFAPRKQKSSMTPQQCLDHTITHCFERASVMEERRLLALACRHAIGQADVSLETITVQYRQDNRLLHIKQRNQVLCTTKTVLAEEKRMVELAQSGKGKFAALYTELPELGLDGQQAEAVEHILTTTDQVSIVKGGAGTGKTSLMRNAVRLIEDTGKKVFVVAPTAEASRGVLRNEGFENAETVAKLLADQELQSRLTGQVLWVDEAGLLGTQDMVKLLEIATARKARLILGGDTRQHASVVRGDALRILNTIGGIKSAEVSKIYRQRNHQYRAAVEELAKSNITKAFDTLDALGAVKEAGALNAYAGLVDDYMKAVKAGKSVLVVSPTHKEGEAVTKEIRDRLRKAGKLGGKEEMRVKYASLNMTEAEKCDWRNYKEGQLVQFNQNVKGLPRGSKWTVKEIKGFDVVLDDGKGKTATLPRNKAGSFDVYAQSEIYLSKGDQLRITRNGYDLKDKRLNNGMTLEVVKAGKNGATILRNAVSKTHYEVPADFGHIAHAYCLTSHASQGKTVDEVFIAQPAATFPATDLKQFYVSVSRGRDAVHIYTDDKDELLRHASAIGDRQSAIELVKGKSRHKGHVERLQRQKDAGPQKQPIQSKEIFRTTFNIDKHHEPGI